MAGPMAMALISPAREIWGGSGRSQELKTPALIKALRRSAPGLFYAGLARSSRIVHYWS